MTPAEGEGWADVEADRSLATLENTASRTKEVLRALLAQTKMSVFELLQPHVQSRGSPAPDAASADLAVIWDDLVTDYAAVAAYMNF